MSTGAPEPLNPAEIDQQLANDLAAITDAHTRALVTAWAIAWSEVSADLRDVLTDLTASSTKVTTATVARVPALAQALAQIADRLDTLAEHAGITITSDLDHVVQAAVDGQVRLMTAQVADEVRRATLNLDRTAPNRALDAIVERFTERVTSQTQPLADETYDVIQREVTRGIAVGDNPRTTARRIVDRAEDKWNLGLNRALVIARTEVLDAHREGARAQQDEHAGVLAGWVWLAHLGPRTCRSCLANHGQLHPLDEPGPIDHQQGRCSRTPVVSEEDGTVDLSWVPDAETFFDDLPVAQQVGILGISGWKAWQRGEFPRSAWTKTRQTDGWRDSMVPASPADRAPQPVAG